MLEKRSFKVITSVTKYDGSHYWLRLGSAFTNKDGSINVYLDAMPKDHKFQLRELDEEDFRKRDPGRINSMSPIPAEQPAL
jgi:hypothetical protein